MSKKFKIPVFSASVQDIAKLRTDFLSVFPYAIEAEYIIEGSQKLKCLVSEFGEPSLAQRAGNYYVFFIQDAQKWDFFEKTLYFRDERDAVLCKLRYDDLLKC